MVSMSLDALGMLRRSLGHNHGPPPRKVDFEEVQLNLFFRKWSTVASLAILLWELFIVLPHEVQHIWRRPVNRVKVTYVFSRYFAIAVQSVNTYLVFKPLARFPIHEGDCKAWFSFLIASACLLMAALDFILMLRVFALHRKDTRIGVFLVVLFMAQIAADAALSPKAVLEIPYDGICDSEKTHPSVIYFAISVWVTHISLGVLTLMKKDLVESGIPVARLVTRDGAFILIAICAIFATIVPYSFVRQVSKAHIVFGWPISLLSIGCCRIIMNFQTLNRNPPPSSHCEIQLECLSIPDPRTGTSEPSVLAVEDDSDIIGSVPRLSTHES